MQQYKLVTQDRDRTSFSSGQTTILTVTLSALLCTATRIAKISM